MTAFTEALSRHDGLGVTGHSDDRWRCGLLTQAMVSRRHWEIFGHLFPLQIRDWYTDNWMSALYGPAHTHCRIEFRIANGSAGQRYSQCDQPLWREALTDAQRCLEVWKRKDFVQSS